MGRTGHFRVTDLHQESESKHANRHGLHWFTASIFIITDMMGAGMVALPVAISNGGLISGTILLIAGAFFSCFTGIQLSQNWTIMQRRWSEYREHCRRPYPEMAFRALGLKAKYAMDLCLALTLYGVVTVFLLFSAKNISILLEEIFALHLDYCILILIVSILVWPFILLRSPMHFWQAGAVAAGASMIAALLIVIGIARDASVCYQHVSYPEFSWTNLFLAYGTMVFSYGGHSAFPTIQHDMKRPSQFSKSVIVSYIMILLVYLHISLLGYSVYGESIRESVIPSIQLKWIAVAVNILITLHVLPAILLIFSPLAQQVDEWLKFGYKRVLSRSVVFLLCVFTAETVPKFGLILDLVGGSTVTLMTMLLPSIFWLFLNTIDKQRRDDIPPITEILNSTPRKLLILNVVSLLFGLIGGIAATTAAVSQKWLPRAMFSGSFKAQHMGSVLWEQSIAVEDTETSLSILMFFALCSLFILNYNATFSYRKLQKWRKV